MISHPWWPAHQFKELLSEARWSDCAYGFFLEGARLIFTIQERDRITKFGVAWSDDTAEDQHVKCLPFLSCVLSLSSQRHYDDLHFREPRPSCQSQIHRTRLKSVSRLRGRLHWRQRTNRLGSSNVPEVRRTSWYVFPPQNGHASRWRFCWINPRRLSWFSILRPSIQYPYCDSPGVRIGLLLV